MPRKTIKMTPGTMPTTAREDGRERVPDHASDIVDSNSSHSALRTISHDLCNHERRYKWPGESAIVNAMVRFVTKDILVISIGPRAVRCFVVL